MAFTGDILYKTQAEIVEDMRTDLLNIITDAYTGEDGQLMILFEIVAGQVESILLANQLVLDDMFIQTASRSALIRHGDQEGLPMKVGTIATGELTFTGEGGIFIDAGTEVSTDPDASTLLFYTVTEPGNIPNPGNPSAPTVAVGSATGLTGAYDYAVSFVTDGGETLVSDFSALINVSNQKVNLTAIALGGPGTTKRKIYRRKAGTLQGLLTTINDNSTTTFTDSTADGSITVANLPTTSTANTVTLDGESEDVGIQYNVVVGAISQLADVPAGITSVSNLKPWGNATTYGFTPGSDPEDVDTYRSRLIQYKQAPKTGSALDLENEALTVAGVETARVFPNDNLGTPQNGHTTVRISGTGGTVPGGTLVAAVQAVLDAFDVANLQIHVTTFTPKVVNVTVVTTLESGFVLADVTSAVQTAVSNYINSVSAGNTVYLAGLIDSVFGDVAGVKTISISSPVSDTTTTSTEKAVAGTITVT